MDKSTELPETPHNTKVKSDRATARVPNIISNAEPTYNLPLAPVTSQICTNIDMNDEEVKNAVASVSVSQFVRNVQSKSQLIFALSVQGK